MVPEARLRCVAPIDDLRERSLVICSRKPSDGGTRAIAYAFLQNFTLASANVISYVLVIY